MNADGSNQIKLSNNATAKDLSPTWSPDGTKIVFVSDIWGNFEVYIINADGTGVPAGLTNIVTPQLTCGFGTVPEGNECVIAPAFTQQIADLLATIAALPENVINSLIDGVNSLVGIDEKDAEKLLEELDDALEGVEEGNEEACDEVEKFVKEVNELVEDGDLTLAEAQPLLDEANSLLAECPVDVEEAEDD